MIEQESATLFVNEEKLDDAVRRYLSDLGVAVQPYVAVADYLRSHAFEDGLLLDSVKTCYYLASCALEKSVVRFALSPIPAMKAVKNEAEIAGYRRAMTRDGVAMVKFLRWLQPAVEAGGQTEISLDKKLTALRAEQDLFRGISFDTIVGYEAHGAIVHYEATPETDIPVEPRGLVLIDSGAQYQDGTTDITRTIALGPVTEEQCRVYTLVLKGPYPVGVGKVPRWLQWHADRRLGTRTAMACGAQLPPRHGPRRRFLSQCPRGAPPGAHGVYAGCLACGNDRHQRAGHLSGRPLWCAH